MDRLSNRYVFPLITLLSLLCASDLSLAAPQEYPGANGQPFQALQEQINAIEASHQEELAAIQQQVQELVTTTADLQSQIDANMGDVDALSNQVEQNQLMITMLEAQLAALKYGLETGCPKDNAVRQVLPNGTVVCEYDDGADQTIVSVIVDIPHNSRGSAFAPCPSGYVITGGGHWAPTVGRYFVVNQSFPFSNGWMTYAFNTFGDTRSLEAYAICARSH